MKRRTLLTGMLAGTTLLAGGGTYYWTHRWNYILIHHSAGSFGSIPFLQQVHRERQAGDPIDAIPYHFIIGNGKGLGDGQIDHDFRRDYHLWGMHVSANNVDRNYRGLGICLIGNLDKQAMTEKQYSTLVSLTRQLMQDYNIPISNVSGHGHTVGESTRCPGKFFPMAQFFQDIS